MAPEQSITSNGDWSRDEWLARADAMLDIARAHATPGAGRIVFPGAEGGYGRAVDGLEGFARTFLLAGFRIAGARGDGVDDLIAFYRRGIVTGVDPDAPDRWVRPDEHGQAKVEAASLALVLDLTRPWIWDTLDALTQQRVIDYFAPVVGDDTYPHTNWVWFRIVVQTFLRSVGGPWSRADIDADLAAHDSFVREGGWLSDGDERSYDHYIGWALHVYPILWSRMSGASELAAGRTPGDVARLDEFLHDALALVGADGSPLLQGRSLIYRFAAAAPFWAGVIAETSSHDPGRLRHAANRIVAHFADHGAPDDRGILTMGWHYEWRPLAQSYSGPGSPYWAVKGFLGILLPADHPVWDAASVPLPVEQSDLLTAIASPGWAVSATASDGIVRIANHGTDHARPGALVADSPLYARIGYATAAAPLVDERGWLEPLEQSVALVDGAGRATHRTAMTPLGTRVDGAGDARVAIAASTWDAHWVAPSPTAHRHGSGLAGDVEIAARITVHSLLRGSCEVRVAVVDRIADDIDAGDLTLRIGGWALAGAAGSDEAVAAGRAPSDAAAVALGGRVSGVRALTAGGTARLVEHDEASPLGSRAVVPVVEYAVDDGVAVVALIELAGGAEPRVPVAEARVHGTTIAVRWPDGIRTEVVLSDSEQPGGGARHHGTRRGVSHAIAKEQHA